MGAIKELNLIEEIAARLNRGEERKEFAKRLAAFLKEPKGRSSAPNKPSAGKPRITAHSVVPVAIPKLDHYLARELTVYARIKEQCGVEFTWPQEEFAAMIEKFGVDRVALWEQKYGLRVGTIPDYVVKSDAAFPPTKPRAWFYEQVAAGKVGRLDGDVFVPDTEAFRLRPAVVLFDPRQKPAYKDGLQMWPKDEQFLGAIVTTLRQEEILKSFEWCPIGSRFGVSPNDWEQAVKPALGNHPDFANVTWQLEPVMVWNFLCQAHPDFPRARDGQTNTWVFFEEYFEGVSSRLHGGGAVYGGLAYVYWRGAGDRSDGWSVRPLGVLA